MSLNNPVEHFVTLFDSSFLPIGMALHDSLMKHGQLFHLWIVCMDELVEDQLQRISLPNVTLIPVSSIETRDLLDLKKGRTRGEYCWTITPFTFEAVFDRDANVERVTYLDADLFFFSNPQILLQELNESRKHVLITEHAYAPEYNYWSVLSGRFCVQFLTFRKTAEAIKVMRWWQMRCLEWCFARFEDGKFGDQKYLDSWPNLFADEIHIVRKTDKTLAPWNEKYFEIQQQIKLDPVFFHFHEFRIVAPNKAKLYSHYRIGKEGLKLYDIYLSSISKSITTLYNFGISVPFINKPKKLKETIWRIIMRQDRFKKISLLKS
ncbi:MAG TPA: glycosyl transferase [Nitrospirota bacterium]|nr:glycosyl transferase [Nitrospirota bacterium]HUL01204.1 glycosyl transferase [Nitrospirota bacterium]